MTANGLIVAMTGIAILLLVAYTATGMLGSRIASRRVAGASFICAAGSAVLGLTPVLAIPLLVASASGFVVTFDGDRVLL